jgi:hypothetical protein
VFWSPSVDAGVGSGTCICEIREGFGMYLSKLCRSLYVFLQATKRCIVVLKVCAFRLSATALQISHGGLRNVVVVQRSVMSAG